MPSPFPGMDPWLEHPDVFPDVHDRLVTYISDALNERLPSPYFANTATRVWVEISERMIGPALAGASASATAVISALGDVRA